MFWLQLVQVILQSLLLCTLCNDVSPIDTTLSSNACPCSLTNNSWNRDSSKIFISPQEYEEKPLRLTFCFFYFEDKVNITLLNLVSTPLSFKVAFRSIDSSSVDDIRRCDIVFMEASQKDNQDERSLLCPGNCLPIPAVTLDWKSMLTTAFCQPQNTSITCSLSLATLCESARNQSISKDQELPFYLSLIGLSRLNECREIPLASQTPVIPRRRINILILYLGSEMRKELMLKQQEIIRNEFFHGDEAVLAWMATEEVYPCRPGTEKCAGGVLIQEPLDNTMKMVYLSGFVLTDLHPKAPRWNGRSWDEYAGWSCAQRRPLRSLAHTLHLFEPALVVMLDDDTYLNWRVLVEMSAGMVAADVKMPTVFGNNHSKTLLGGAGIILGKNALDRLRDNKLYNVREPLLAKSSQIAAQAFHLAASCGDTKETCIGLSQRGQVEVHTNVLQTLQTRLVDFCVAIFSNENTCYHRCVWHVSKSPARESHHSKAVTLTPW